MSRVETVSKKNKIPANPYAYSSGNSFAKLGKIIDGHVRRINEKKRRDQRRYDDI